MKSSPAEQSSNIFQKHPQSHAQTEKWYKSHLIYCVLLCTILGSLPALAQPSAGPYGPVWQSYDLPKGTGRIYYVAPDGQAEQSGMTLDKPTTLAAAMERVETGDAIVLRGGIYRTGNLKFNQSIIMQPYMDEHPILKGTQIATQWENPKDGLWKTSWTHLFASKPADWWRPRRSVPLCLFNNDMVFIDGKLLNTVGSQDEVDENSFYIDYDAEEVFIGIDPNDRLVEITAFDSAIIRTTRDCHGKTSDGKGPVIRGITFTQYAYRAIEIEGKDPEGLSDESNHGKDVVGTTFEHCTISFCSRVAGYLRGDKLTIRHCLVSDTSTEGIYIIGSADVLLEKNIFRRNNIENIRGYFPAAVKIFNQCYRTTCKDNLVIDHPNSNGIWYDVGNVDGRIINNWFQEVGHISEQINVRQFQSRRNAFFFEISKGAICAGNVFVNCNYGIFVLNSSDVQIYQNTLVNSPAYIGRSGRSAVGDHFGWHPSTGPDVDERDGHVFVNNLLTADEQYRGHLLQFWQQRSLRERLNKPQVKHLDYNVYVRCADTTSQPLILWSPAASENSLQDLNSPEDLHKLHPEFSAHSLYFDNYDGPLFKSPELGNYELLKAFPGSKAASPLPTEIRELLGWSTQEARFPGAYPPLQ
jgi:parallel beta-helix repeat protein